LDVLAAGDSERALVGLAAVVRQGRRQLLARQRVRAEDGLLLRVLDLDALLRVEGTNQ
jgi:hypothetical protein